MDSPSPYKWRNLCLGVKISINSGTALLIYLPAFFLLYWWAGKSERLAGLYPMAIATLTGAFGIFWAKRNSDKKAGMKAEVEKMKIEAGNAKPKE